MEQSQEVVVHHQPGLQKLHLNNHSTVLLIGGQLELLSTSSCTKDHLSTVLLLLKIKKLKIRKIEKLISKRELEKNTRTDLRRITRLSMKKMKKSRKTFPSVEKGLLKNILMILKILLRHFWSETQNKDSVILEMPKRF